MKAIINKRYASAHGFTLIELLLTLALGAFVLTTSITLYQHAKGAYTASGKQLLITEKLAVSQRLLQEASNGSINSCYEAPTRLSLVNSSQFWLQAGESPAEIYTTGNNIVGLKRIGTQIGEREAESDVLLLRSAALPATSIVTHDIEHDKFIVRNGIGLTRGELAIACDENVAVVFQVAYTTGRHIHYSGSGIVPGNCAEAFTSEQCGGSYRLGKEALLAHYAPSVFYIANGYAGLALYRQKPTIFRNNHNRRLSLRAQEMVSGIIRLHAALGNADSGQKPEIVVEFTIVANTKANKLEHEKYLYTLLL